MYRYDSINHKFESIQILVQIILEQYLSDAFLNIAEVFSFLLSKWWKVLLLFFFLLFPAYYSKRIAESCQDNNKDARYNTFKTV